MSKTRRNILIFFGLSNIALLAASLIYGYITSYSISTGEEIIVCFFKESLHIYCPGCGGSRSLYYLLRLDIIKSFIYFPALIISLFIILELDVRAAVSFVKDDPSPIFKFNKNELLIIPIVIFLNFFIRNILLFSGIDYIGDIKNYFL